MNSMQKLISFYEHVIETTAEKFLNDHTECNGLLNDKQPFNYNII